MKPKEPANKLKDIGELYIDDVVLISLNFSPLLLSCPS